MTSQSLAGSFALLRAFMSTKAELVLPIPLIESVRSVRIVEPQSEGDDIITYAVRITVDAAAAAQALARAARNEPHSALPAGAEATLAALGSGTYDYVTLSESNAREASALALRLHAFIINARGGEQRAVAVQDLRDNGIWDELALLALVSAATALAVFVPVRSVFILDARVGSVQAVETSIIGRFCSNEVFPLSKLQRFDEHVKRQQDSDGGNDWYEYYPVALISSNSSNGADEVVRVSISNSANRADVAAVLDTLSAWLRVHRINAADAAASASASASASANSIIHAGSGSGSSVGESASVGEMQPLLAADARDSGAGASASAVGTQGNNGNGTGSKVCVVCMDERRPVRTVFLPCKHLACCEVCASVLDKCPLCRRPVEQTMAVFT